MKYAKSSIINVIFIITLITNFCHLQASSYRYLLSSNDENRISGIDENPTHKDYKPMGTFLPIPTNDIVSTSSSNKIQKDIKPKFDASDNIEKTSSSSSLNTNIPLSTNTNPQQSQQTTITNPSQTDYKPVDPKAASQVIGQTFNCLQSTTNLCKNWDKHSDIGKTAGIINIFGSQTQMMSNFFPSIGPIAAVFSGLGGLIGIADDKPAPHEITHRKLDQLRADIHTVETKVDNVANDVKDLESRAIGMEDQIRNGFIGIDKGICSLSQSIFDKTDFMMQDTKRELGKLYNDIVASQVHIDISNKIDKLKVFDKELTTNIWHQLSERISGCKIHREDGNIYSFASGYQHFKEMIDLIKKDHPLSQSKLITLDDIYTNNYDTDDYAYYLVHYATMTRNEILVMTLLWTEIKEMINAINETMSFDHNKQYFSQLKTLATDVSVQRGILEKRMVFRYKQTYDLFKDIEYLNVDRIDIINSIVFKDGLSSFIQNVMSYLDLDIRLIIKTTKLQKKLETLDNQIVEIKDVNNKSFGIRFDKTDINNARITTDIHNIPHQPFDLRGKYFYLKVEDKKRHCISIRALNHHWFTNYNGHITANLDKKDQGLFCLMYNHDNDSFYILTKQQPFIIENMNNTMTAKSLSLHDRQLSVSQFETIYDDNYQFKIIKADNPHNFTWNAMMTGYIIYGYQRVQFNKYGTDNRYFYVDPHFRKLRTLPHIISPYENGFNLKESDPSFEYFILSKVNINSNQYYPFTIDNTQIENGLSSTAHKFQFKFDENQAFIRIYCTFNNQYLFIDENQSWNSKSVIFTAHQQQATALSVNYIPDGINYAQMNGMKVSMNCWQPNGDSNQHWFYYTQSAKGVLSTHILNEPKSMEKYLIYNAGNQNGFGLKTVVGHFVVGTVPQRVPRDGGKLGWGTFTWQEQTEEDTPPPSPRSPAHGGDQMDYVMNERDRCVFQRRLLGINSRQLLRRITTTHSASVVPRQFYLDYTVSSGNGPVGKGQNSHGGSFIFEPQTNT